MTRSTRDILERVRTWPKKDQDELAEVAREIEARRSQRYRLSPDERERIERSLADLEAGRYASDERIASRAESATDALLRGERAVQVRAAIARLPKKQRATLILRVYHELPHEEIAGIARSRSENRSTLPPKR